MPARAADLPEAPAAVRVLGQAGLGEHLGEVVREMHSVFPVSVEKA